MRIEVYCIDLNRDTEKIKIDLKADLLERLGDNLKGYDEIKVVGLIDAECEIALNILKHDFVARNTSNVFPVINANFQLVWRSPMSVVGYSDRLL